MATTHAGEVPSRVIALMMLRTAVHEHGFTSTVDHDAEGMVSVVRVSGGRESWAVMWTRSQGFMAATEVSGVLTWGSFDPGVVVWEYLLRAC